MKSSEDTCHQDKCQTDFYTLGEIYDLSICEQINDKYIQTR